MGNRESALQSLCRSYLSRLRSFASSYAAIGSFIDDTIAKNERGECKGTEEECRLLARCLNDERVSRVDIPKILGKSYRKCVEDEDFEKIGTLARVGIYSKLSVLLHKSEIEENGKAGIVCKE